jgi:hypothetical protein
VGDSGNIVRTTDGGTSWTPQSSGTTAGLFGVSFTDANTGTAVGSGGTIFRTTDGGTNWTPQSSGTGHSLKGVSFMDANSGTAVGGAGTIVRTTDGGTNWTPQLSGQTWRLRGVSFTDANTGTAVGDGAILRTLNGGVPVELTSFTATANGKEVKLNWSTATETNNQGFEIQRKLDNYVWDKIGFVEGHGTTTEPQEYLYIDELNGVNAASIAYRLKQLDFDGSYEYSYVVFVNNLSPVDYGISQNFPNPFNPVTTISYSLPIKSQVELVVYNTLGEKVKQLVIGEKEAGSYSVELNATSLASGVYFYRLQAGSYIETKKMVLMR